MMTPWDLRQIALSLPEAEERETWGEATFRVRNKIFLMLSGDERSASIKATLEDQTALVALQPETFGIPAYVGRHGWIRVWLASAETDQVRELIIEAWRRTAPKRLAAVYDGR